MKTGYTRGASTKEIFQNRVTRNNPVLIPWEFWSNCRIPDDGSQGYENGFIVLLEPAWYFETPNADALLAAEGVELGKNALLIFRRRSEWDKYAPRDGRRLPNGMAFDVARSRTAPLGGTYFARVHGTTSEPEVVVGYNTTQVRGAGIRVFEYASSRTIEAAKLQLEALIWLCADAESAMAGGGMHSSVVTFRKKWQLLQAEQAGLLDRERLHTLRMIDDDSHTICPLCKNRMEAADFFKRSEQAEGRETYDLTLTEVSLFHIQELRIGKFQHKPYNLGWGHAFCNTVVKDAGIMPTLEWMQQVIANQGVRDIQAEAASVEEAVEG